ncbi:hypothetical protein [Sphingomonas crocodyli]|uniref:Uncharacterized protein n=1 Tax=Sphingomonas crocodyli TaxID=1979270 RepID=A0A437M5I7_9SPHN|nr:hypothetical protein [Sphingomonas crocodyli]RVT92843.1 hypothetical protein EOD43_02705 [Sphingomonas crocodyli]
MITVTLADGRKVDVRTNDPQKAAKIAHGWSRGNPKGLPKAPPSSALRTARGLAGNFAEGVLPGSSGFLSGAGKALVNAAEAPFSDEVDFEPMASYSAGQRDQEAQNKATTQEHPYLSGAAQFGGMAAGVLLPGANIARGASLGQKAYAGVKTAGAYGVASGLMSSKADNVSDRVADAVSSGAIGAMTGGAFPVAGRIASATAAPLRPIIQPVVSAAGRGLQRVGASLPGRAGTVINREGQQLARDRGQAAGNQRLDRMIREAPHPVTGGPMRPAQVAPEVARRQQMGVPAVAADISEPVRSGFRTAVRSPGPAVSAVRRAIDQRQAQAAERATGHIGATLGPVGNVEAQARALTEEAKRVAGPLFDLSDAQPIPLTRELQELFSRPGGNRAMRHAATSLQDEGLEPLRQGLVEAADGSFSLGPVPGMKFYDRAKSSLDEEVFAGRSPFATPDVQRHARGAASIRARLLSIMDGGEDFGTGTSIPPEGLNPHWKPARDAYGGPVQSRKALELGQELATSDAAEIGNRMAAMTPEQVGHFRLGHRSGLAADVRAVPDYGDPARRLGGTLERREALTAAHGPEASGRLLERLDAEQDASRTYQAIRGVNGDVAPNIEEQERAIADAAGSLVQIVSGHPGGLLSAGRALLKGDRTGTEADAFIADVLGIRHPDLLQAAMRDVGRERARRTLVDQNAARAVQQGGRVLGGILGTNMIEPADPSGY